MNDKIIKMLQVGPSHTGKTTSISTLPGQTIDFNFDPGGYQSIRAHVQVVQSLRAFWETKETIKQVLVVDYSSIPRKVLLDKFPQPMEAVAKNFMQDVNTLEENLDKFTGTVLDSAISFGDAVLEYIAKLQGHSYAGETKKNESWGIDYRLASLKVEEIIDALLGLPKHFIFLCHLQAQTDATTLAIQEIPLIFGKALPASIPRKFSEVFMNVVRNDGPGGRPNYLWQTWPDEWHKYLGTRRLQNLDKFVKPNFKELYKMES